MTDQMFAALTNTIVLLGQKDKRSKEETLAYNAVLGHLTAVCRYNRLLAEEAIDEHLDVTRDPATRST